MIPSNSLKNIKPQRGLGQAITRQRRKAMDGLRREQESRRNSERDRAREELNRLANQQRNDGEHRWRSNLLAAVVSSQTAVVRSYGLATPIHGKVLPGYYGRNLRAYTDFQSITVDWPYDLIPHSKAKTEVVLDTVAQMRGVVQHELGHILHTVPLNVLAKATIDNESSPLYNRYFSPLVGGGKAKASGLHKAWNILEDQRMESAMVRDVPRLATYFTSMVMTHIVNNRTTDGTMTWLLVAGRNYLPAHIRDMAHDLFVQTYGSDIPTIGDQWKDIVATYKAAKTHDDLMLAVIDAQEFLLRYLQGGPEGEGGTTTHRQDPEGESSSKDPSESATEDGDEDDEDESDGGESKPSKSGKPGEDGEDGDDASDGNGTADADSDEDNESGAGQSSNGEGEDTSDATSGSRGVSKGDLKEAMQKALNKANEQVRNDKDNLSVLADAYDRNGGHGTLGDATFSCPDMPADSIMRAERTSVGMEQALSDFVTASQPVWLSHQERGIIDPIAFRTKSVGDRDYHRAMSGEAASGLDLHVSMLCDVSVSMNGDPMLALSEAIYATALACQRLNVGATFSLWSDVHSNCRIWSDGNVTPSHWHPLGGTDPTVALDDLHAHNPEGAANHLVIVFTDGDWGSADSYNLQNWSAPGRQIVLVRWGARRAPHYGADDVVDINEVEHLPMELTRAIQRILSQ